MNPRINQLVKTLLQKDSLEQCSLPELEQFAERHPYFGAAQLLLTKKMQSADPGKYDEQLQKTFLFFHNPLWVEHLLNDTGNGEIIPPKKEEPVTIKEEVILPAPVVEEKEQTWDEPAPAGLSSDDTSKQEAAPPAMEISFSMPAPPQANEELVFEPYHTVDYFASQGIKVKEEEKPKDKFGQQLKSFTDWLKAMKKLPATEIAKGNEPVAEQKVEQMAEHSLKEREVLTEAMAEVWEKQGNAAKALEVYSKLSLLEPSKSAYFAAKIEDLKKQT